LLSALIDVSIKKINSSRFLKPIDPASNFGR